MALIYLLLLVAAGDTLARPFLRYTSAIHRLAAAFLVGLVVASWATYLAALAFSVTVAQPLGPADALVMVAGTVLVGARLVADRAWRRRPRLVDRLAAISPSTAWDWIVLNLLAVLVVWLMTQTLGFADNRILFGAHEWGDVAPTMELAQSFALGHNYPTTYPLFAGPPILYHFLFYLQAGNLTFLGFDPATANNVLAIASLISLVGLVMALGRRLFGVALVGRLAAIAFFFHGSLAFVSFLRGFATPQDALNGVLALDHYLPSGLPYRGEDWATWSLNVFLNQRHLASAIGIVVLALLFVVDRVLPQPGSQLDAEARAATEADRAAGPESPSDLDAGRRAGGRPAPRRWSPRGVAARVRTGLRDPALRAYVAVGVLVGLLPLWNGPMYVAAAALLAVVFVLFGNRVQMAALGAAAGIVSLPQVLFLRQPGIPGTVGYPMLHLGYTVDPPTLANIVTFLGVDFGPKLLLALAGLLVASWGQRRVFLAISALAIVAFTVQLSVDIVADHKLLNAWLVLLNIFAAWGLVRLWRAGGALRRGVRLTGHRAMGRWAGRALGLAGKIAAVTAAGVIVTGGVIDLMPVRNDGRAAYQLAGDEVFDWVVRETQPGDLFLTDVVIAHPILLAGRPIYFGWPVYAWSAGYDVPPRQATYVRMLQETSPRALLELLQANGIRYVAYDDAIRKGTTGSLIQHPNEAVFQAWFQAVFREAGDRWGHLVIYRVPQDPAAADALPNPAPLPTPTPSPVSMVTGGRGDAPGMFVDPRGLAVTSSGEVLVADAGNDRIQRFAADGTFEGELGSKGSGDGQLNEPNGVAVDSHGHLFVADTANQRIQELDASGAFVRSWGGPAPGFYGPRDLAVSADDTLYILDQGHDRVVRLGPDGTVTTFGSAGSGDGQLSDPTGLAVSAAAVFVADPSNARIAVFDTDGQYLRSIAVPDWLQGSNRFADVAVTPDGSRLYASSAATHDVLAFDEGGTLVGRLAPAAGQPPLGGPGGLALRSDGGIYVADYDASRIVPLPTP